MQDKDWYVKSDEISIEEYGCYPGARPIEELIKTGLFILDKWRGPTSHDVSSMVRNLLKIKKSGHSGTLDPMVSGVLPITLGSGCKVIPALQGLDKEYVGIMHIHKNTSMPKLRDLTMNFTGKITQLPPVRSAVLREPRIRRIDEFSLLSKSGRNVVFRVKCQAGTYIRKLIDDFGKKIGGAHMKELRRTSVGIFDESRTHKIQDLKDAYVWWKENQDEKIREFILPIEEAIECIGKIIIKDSAVHTIVNGAPLYTGGIARVQKGIKINHRIAILTLKGELVALANASMPSKDMKSKRGKAAQTDRVIMEKGVYPRLS